MDNLSQVEYEALRSTIRERGSVRLCAVLAGLIAWGATAISVLITDLEGAITLVPFVILLATFEISFFIHTGVERVGRYLQVFYEEREHGPAGWETTIMRFGQDFRGGSDPLFSALFVGAGLLNFLALIPIATNRPGWLVVSAAAYVGFVYRTRTTRKSSAAQRVIDLERFRGLKSASQNPPSN